MDLKNLRKVYGYPVTLLKQALAAANNDETALQTEVKNIAGNYAAQLNDRPTEIKIWGCAKSGSKVAIVELLSERYIGAICDKANDLAKLALNRGTDALEASMLNDLIAKYSINIKLGNAATPDFKNRLVGVYNHRGRFLSIVTLEASVNIENYPESELTANYLAKNALYFYGDFTSRFQHQYSELRPIQEIGDILKVMRHAKDFAIVYRPYLRAQRIIFNEQTAENPHNVHYCSTTVENYLKAKEKQLCAQHHLTEVSFDIDNIGIFGKFD